MNLSRKQKALILKNLVKKNLVDKIHKLIVKKLKLNVNCHIKIGRNHNFFQV
jgi:hypothetical protein